MIYARTLSGLSYGDLIVDLLIRTSLLVPAVFGFSDFVSVCLAWRRGYSKSPRSILRFSGYAAAMGAASSLAMPPKPIIGPWWALKLDPVAAGLAVLAVPAWSYVRSGEKSLEPAGVILSASVVALLISASTGALGGLLGVTSALVPWLVPRNFFSRGPAEMPPPPAMVSAGSLEEDFAEVRRLMMERLAEG